MADLVFDYGMENDLLSCDRTAYNDYELIDKTLRAAVNGNCQNELKELTDRIKKLSSKNPVKTKMLAEYKICIILLQQIFTVKSDYEGLKLLYDLQRKCECDIHGFSSVWVPENYIKQTTFLTACLTGLDDILKPMIDNDIVHICFDVSNNFFNVLYFIMICDRKSLINYYISRFTVNMEQNNIPKHYLTDKYGYVTAAASAAIFRDSESLKEMFDTGIVPSIDQLFSYLTGYPDTIEYLVKNFYTELGYTGTTPPTLTEFASQVINDKIYKLLLITMKKLGEADMVSLSEKLPPITVINYSDISSGYESDKVIETAGADNINIKFNDTKCCYDMRFISKKLFGDRRITIDFSENLPNISFFSVSEAKKLLSFDIKPPQQEEKVTQLMLPLLSLNSKAVTKLMIDKGIINPKNYLEAAKVASETRCFNSLSTISNSLQR